MKVRINTNQRITSKQNYYDKLKNLLERIDDKIEKSPTNNNEEREENHNPESKNEIIISELEKSSCSSSNDKNKKIIFCAICSKDEFKYICPKCKVKYCSVKCFKEHNLDCTENFYKKCVEEELKSTKIEDSEKQSFKRNIQNIFSKQAKEDEIYDQEKLKDLSQNKINHLEEILIKLNNNTLDLDKDLSKDDWESFTKFMDGFSNENYANEIQGSSDKNNKINLLQIWKPFWETKLANGFEPSLIAYDNCLLFDLDEASKRKLKDFELNEFLEYQEENESNEIKFKAASAADEEKESKNFDFAEMKDIAEEISENVEDFNSFINPYATGEEGKEEAIQMEDKIQFISLNNKRIRIDRNIIYRSVILKYENVPYLNTLSKITPSDKNLLTLIDLMLNMSYLSRLYNGELSDKDNILDIIAFLTHYVKVLYDKNIAFQNTLEVLNKFKLYVSSYEKNNSKFIFELGIKDLLKIVKNKFFIVECLFRLYEIIHKFLKEFKSDLNKFNDNKSDPNNRKYQELIKNLMLGKHKILYFLSYVKGLSSEKLEELVKGIKSVIKENEEINKFGAKMQTFINKSNNISN